MAALTDLSDIVNRLTGGNSGTPEQLSFYIDPRVGSNQAANTVSGRFSSLWGYNKAPGGGGATPTSAAIPVNGTAGALFQTNPGGGREKWLLGMSAAISQAGCLLLYDRLVHQGGLSGTSTSAQTTNLPTTALTRNTGGVGNQIFLEIYSAIGSTARTVTASYTNQAGTASRTTQAVDIGGTGLQEAQRTICLPLQDGDSGVRSVESVTLSASTGTAGNFGVTIARPLLVAQCNQGGSGTLRDLIAGLPSVLEIDTDACLSFMFLANGTTPPTIFGTLSMIEA